jgi:peptide/nickel transport system ATP-binding protein
MSPILEIENLHAQFVTYEGVVRALNGIDLTINESEIVGLVGETGSGKSVLTTAILNAVRAPGRIVDGAVRLDGRDLLVLTESEMQRIRGVQISLIATNPRSKLNPLLRIGPQIGDIIRAHEPLSKEIAGARAIELLKSVGINDPERRARAYPHELSGGMAQRVLIAMALAGSPRLLIADEATNGLDVTVQRQVLDLMRDKVRELRTSALIVTHDLGIVAQYCQRVAIVYAGQIVEQANTEQLFRHPRHPYTISLLASSRSSSRQEIRLSLVGSRPDLKNLPHGCLLHPRCPFFDPGRCLEVPRLQEIEPGHFVRCFRAGEPLQEMVHA